VGWRRPRMHDLAKSTYWYLHAVSELLALAAGRLEHALAAIMSPPDPILQRFFTDKLLRQRQAVRTPSAPTGILAGCCWPSPGFPFGGEVLVYDGQNHVGQQGRQYFASGTAGGGRVRPAFSDRIHPAKTPLPCPGPACQR
jgi:hypothetical protein